MPTPQEEKERFFAQLDGLDETESEDDSPNVRAQKRQKVEVVHKEPPRPAQDAKVLDVPGENRVPQLGKAFTEHEPLPRETTSLRSGRTIRRTNSEPQPSTRAEKGRAIKTTGTLFQGLNFCECIVG